MFPQSTFLPRPGRAPWQHKHDFQLNIGAWWLADVEGDSLAPASPAGRSRPAFVHATQCFAQMR